MGIKRYVASQDTTITNAFRSNLRTRMTGANMGASDILEVFSIYAQSSSNSSELSRVLVNFPVTDIRNDRTSGKLPSSGSVNFYLRLFNAPHGETLPRNFTLIAQPVSRSWEEGTGLDMEEGLDITRNETGANWVFAGSGSQWTNPGGDFYSSSFAQSFGGGIEDVEMNISPLVENWLNGSTPPNGIGLFLSSSQESENRSFYTKRFFARSSEFFFKKPTIEARWNSSTTDDRMRFYTSSSLLSSADNTHTIYLYNYVGGQLKNIPSIGTGSIYMQVWTSASGGDLLTTTPTVVTGGYYTTGTYSASFALSTTASICYDRWFSGSVGFYTGTIKPMSFPVYDHHIDSRKYVCSISNLKPTYSSNESARLRVFVREKNWNPNVYTVASIEPQGTVIDNAFFRIHRLTDNAEIISYGTGSTNHTKLSYDTKGNFFDLDTAMLESGYAYGIKFVFLIDGLYEEQGETFKFRIKDV
jgi:hypothetical protein